MFEIRHSKAVQKQQRNAAQGQVQMYQQSSAHPCHEEISTNAVTSSVLGKRPRTLAAKLELDEIEQAPVLIDALVPAATVGAVNIAVPSSASSAREGCSSITQYLRGEAHASTTSEVIPEQANISFTDAHINHRSKPALPDFTRAVAHASRPVVHSLDIGSLMMSCEAAERAPVQTSSGTESLSRDNGCMHITWLGAPSPQTGRSLVISTLHARGKRLRSGSSS
jgi:hypothetical protein